MAYQVIPISRFLQLSAQYPVFDVRSPAEYQHAHLPEAVSLPLFDDDERRIVGTIYKQVSREAAIKAGLDFFGPKMKIMVERVEAIAKEKQTGTVLVHCWRGGMRSSAVAWLLDLYGFEVYLLEGGYKKFRNWVLDTLSQTYPIRILGGYTGSGKTEILHALAKMDQPVIDLEGIACHRGSSFGALGQPPQPSNEMFENVLAFRLHHLTQKYPGIPIWIESESIRIGCINIHPVFFEQMLSGQYIRIVIPFEERLKKIISEYGVFDLQLLINGVERIKKRLGGLNTKMATEYLMQKNIPAAFEILMLYYDRFYGKSELFNPPSFIIPLENTQAEQNAEIILKTIMDENNILTDNDSVGDNGKG